jgi:uncharacterized protein
VLRALVARAVHARGALTARGIVDHYRFRGGTARIAPHLMALCRSGDLRELAVSDDGASVYVPAAFDPGVDVRPASGVLLSPFDNLLWDRELTRRLFGFDHLIEIYKKEHERVYGYYVLPFLLADRLVGRVDLKARRDSGTLVAKAFHREAGVRRTSALDEALHGALARLARTLGLATVERGAVRSP